MDFGRHSVHEVRRLIRYPTAGARRPGHPVGVLGDGVERRLGEVAHENGKGSRAPGIDWRPRGLFPTEG